MIVYLRTISLGKILEWLIWLVCPLSLVQEQTWTKRSNTIRRHLKRSIRRIACWEARKALPSELASSPICRRGWQKQWKGTPISNSSGSSRSKRSTGWGPRKTLTPHMLADTWTRGSAKTVLVRLLKDSRPSSMMRWAQSNQASSGRTSRHQEMKKTQLTCRIEWTTFIRMFEAQMSHMSPRTQRILARCFGVRHLLVAWTEDRLARRTSQNCRSQRKRAKSSEATTRRLCLPIKHLALRYILMPRKDAILLIWGIEDKVKMCRALCINPQ